MFDWARSNLTGPFDWARSSSRSSSVLLAMVGGRPRGASFAAEVSMVTLTLLLLAAAGEEEMRDSRDHAMYRYCWGEC